MAISKRKKMKSLLYARHEGDWVQVEVQVAVLTWEINHLNGTHQTTQKKTLIPWIDEKIGRRRNLLACVKTTLTVASELINSLGLVANSRYKGRQKESTKQNRKIDEGFSFSRRFYLCQMLGRVQLSIS